MIYPNFNISITTGTKGDKKIIGNTHTGTGCLSQDLTGKMIQKQKK